MLNDCYSRTIKKPNKFIKSKYENQKENGITLSQRGQTTEWLWKEKLGV